MTILGPVLIVLGTVVVMEITAYSVHRWIMHGPLGWGWHKSHHEPHDHLLEKNDLFAVVFGAISIVLFSVGYWYWMPIWWVGLGFVAYGLLYFIAHDGLVHQRWPFKYIPRKGYLKRLYQAHRLHHAVEGRDGCVSFGFLYTAPIDDLKKRLKAKGQAGAVARDESGAALAGRALGAEPRS
jgi:beta-carotene 3-hydroxylase